MSKFKVTAVLLNKPVSPPFTPQIIDKVEEEFFSSYNAQRRMSELEYKDYENIELNKVDST